MKQSAGKVFFLLLHRELLLASRSPAEFLNPLLFFIIVVSLFPMAVSPEFTVLRTIGPGVIWVAALLATLLSLDTLFRSDYDDGSLEQMLLTPYSDVLLVSAKICAHWLLSGLPIICVSPLLALLLHLPMASVWVLLVSLALGTPVLSLIGAIAMALVVSLRRGGVLLALLVLPLYIPVLIFGTSAVISAGLGLAVQGQLLFLFALFVLALTLAPVTTAVSLRIGIS